MTDVVTEKVFLIYFVNLKRKFIWKLEENCQNFKWNLTYFISSNSIHSENFKDVNVLQGFNF